jgi:uncharacterized protein (TIGR03790 family)
MVSRRRGVSTAVCVVASICVCVLGARPLYALNAENVLVLYNAANPDSAEIANYYLSVHPGARTLGLTNIPPGEQITQAQYRSIIRPQVLAGLDPSVDCIVTTRGLPLRIFNDKTPASFPFSYVDPKGVSRTVYNTSYKQYSSLESELTRVDTMSTWTQMGDQTWWDPLNANPSANPYFGKNVRFSHTDPGNGQLRLATRLDGYSVADVRASIDRARSAYIVRFGQQVVIDDSPAAKAAGLTSMGTLASSVLAARGQSYVYDNSVAPVLTATKPVIGYVSHGVNDGSGQLAPDYMSTQLDFRLARGAIAQTWESYNGYSFTSDGRHGQGLIGDWIEAGGTAGIAQVEEPGASLSSMTNESRMFGLMLSGYTWAEAAWSATPQVSFVNTVIGDPLMVWRNWIPGDANLDGRITVSDYSALRSNWLKAGTFETGDFNGDGFVNSADLTILRASLESQNKTALASTIFLTPPGGANLPEPSTSAGVMLLACVLIRRRRKADFQRC